MSTRVECRQNCGVMVQGYDVPGLMVEEGMADIVRMDCMERSGPSLCAPS
jgi:hypothetical protein